MLSDIQAYHIIISTFAEIFTGSFFLHNNNINFLLPDYYFFMPYL